MGEEKKKYEGFANIAPPETEGNPDEFKCEECDIATVMGLLTGSCQLEEDENKRRECWEAIKPVSEKKKSPEDALTEYLVKYGDRGLDDLVDRMNWLIYKATVRAKDELIKEGKLNPDGTPKE